MKSFTRKKQSSNCKYILTQDERGIGEGEDIVQ